MKREKIINITAQLNEAKYADIEDVGVLISSISDMPLNESQAIFQSLANREIIAPLWKGYPSTLHCFKRALMYIH